MSNILGINIGHNASAALLVDGELVYFCEEERISKVKYDGNPFRAMLMALGSTRIDQLVVAGTSNDLPKLPWTQEDPYSALARKFHPHIKTTFIGDKHHLTHAATAFYNSGFETAVAVVVDGAGSYQTESYGKVGGFETESIYHCSYPAELNALYKRYSDGSYSYFKNDIQVFDGSVTITKAYEAVSAYLGFGFIEAGKTMGLAAYGKVSPEKRFFKDGKADRNLFSPMYPAGAFLQYEEIRHDGKNIPDVLKDIAADIQAETQELVGDLIHKAIEMTGENNVVISGGYGLNVLANQYYKTRFPDVNIYVEPISSDAGIAIGAAKFVHHEDTKSTEIKPLKTLYLGNADDYSMLDSFVVQANVNKQTVSPDKVAQIIADGNIVAIFQGRSEAGPRALGNRSILFDPRVVNGKDIVNTVKGREWFRPFAASIMEEHVGEWFDCSESKFMMYAVDVKTEKLDVIPSVTHVDGTCRIQTVTEEDNKAYYTLLSEFNKLTGVPLLFNTSFNLAGAPLVDSLFDAVNTMMNSEIKYLYLPDLDIILSK